MNLFLSLGASVVNGDIKPPPSPAKDSTTSDTTASPSSSTWLRTDVTIWADLVALFKTALERHGGRVDHVYANAGVSPRAAYLDMEARVDEATGDPLEPSHATYDVNLRGVVNTTALALYYMRRQENPVGGSVVLGCSIGAMQRFRAVDYCQILFCFSSPSPPTLLSSPSPPPFADHSRLFSYSIEPNLAGHYAA